MKDITELPGITPEEAKKLCEADIGTTVEFWETLRNPRGASGLAEKTKIDRHRLVELAHTAALTDQGPGAWLKRRWFDLTSAASLVLLGVLIGYALRSGAVREERHVVLKPEVALAALHRITESDLALRAEAPAPGTFRSTRDVVGRYTLRSLAAGATVREYDISAAALPEKALVGREILAISVRRSALTSASVPRARLILVPRRPQSGTSVVAADDVIVLGARCEADPCSVLVAMSPSKVPSVTDQIGTFDAVLSYKVD
jgi:hypothetical protein